MRGTALAWLTFIGVATWRYSQNPAANSPNAAPAPIDLPPPSIYLGAAAVFSMLALLAAPAPELAATFSWALVVAALTTGNWLPAAKGK